MDAILFSEIFSIENLLSAWKEFLRGKRKRKDVLDFQLHLMDNIFSIHTDIKLHTYNHDIYEFFVISDPKRREIHKATVRDRLVHRAIYRVMYPYFDQKFIEDSFSCRKNKGTHKAIEQFREYSYEASDGYRHTLWVLKCDVRNFFASIDQNILLKILGKNISDKDIIDIFKNIIFSFCSTEPGKGLPLGNLTSQLLVNVYMNEFDQWMKSQIKIPYYIRYADDFVIMSTSRKYLENIFVKIRNFLLDTLHLDLHPDKVFIKTLASGVDFLGWVYFPTHCVLRTVTKRRMLKKLASNSSPETIQSYLGLLSHGNTHKLQKMIVCMNTEKEILV